MLSDTVKLNLLKFCGQIKLQHKVLPDADLKISMCMYILKATIAIFCLVRFATMFMYVCIYIIHDWLFHF